MKASAAQVIGFDVAQVRIGAGTLLIEINNRTP
jgi:hypothetical protein